MESEKIEFFSNYENTEENLTIKNNKTLDKKPTLLKKIELQKPENVFEDQLILSSSKRDQTLEVGQETDFERNFGIKNKEIKKLYDQIVHLEKKAKDNSNSKKQEDENLKYHKHLSGLLKPKTSFITEPSIDSVLEEFPKIKWNFFEHSINLIGKCLKLELEKSLKHNKYDEIFFFRVAVNFQNISPDNYKIIKMKFSTNKSIFFFKKNIIFCNKIVFFLKIRFSL